MRRRLAAGLALLVLIFGIFSIRLFQIQGVDAQAYAAMAVEAGTATSVVPAPRGQILDRSGEALAASVDGMTITADPSMTSAHAPKIAKILIDELGEDQLDYFETIDDLRKPNSRYLVLVRDVPAEDAQRATKAVRDADLTGIFTEKVALRSYPGGRLAANLLGYTDGEEKGVQGLESQYDSFLTGTDGSATYEVSPSGQRIPMADSTVQEMVPGSDVETTIDRDLQWYSDQRLADAVRSSGSDWGLALTMDVRTGQVVQLSQAPTFDPDSKESMEDHNTVSRYVQTVYEPGSVMKPITMAALADQGEITPDTQISVPSHLVIDKFRIADHWDHGRINLTAAGVIAQSSNLGTIIAAQQMDDDTMHDYLAKFGFGTKSGVELPGESQGILPDPSGWSRANHATISFGQGVSVTAMQMIRAIGAIANGGVMVEPSVVEGFVGPDGEKTAAKETKTRRVVSKEAASQVTRMMEAVTADDGTAPAAQIPGYRVAGKTGTAWRVNPDTGKYVRGQNTVSFIGYAPADKPRFVTYVVLDKPHRNAGGGSTAAPVFHDIMSMALERFGVPPTGSKPPKVAQDW
ncbi:peptidoglycan D,D-transpeptidase FtsI family protein [Aeromicrobium sp. CTD01-1L150]|uniref:peptidoglycan D,D-transpeptidase FtsI family protein n=1 Tax=Aeromicrobium sp. CTD01-1L150 TaxID=3341830 RepID=UPI0035BFEE43